MRNPRRNLRPPRTPRRNPRPQQKPATEPGAQPATATEPTTEPTTCMEPMAEPTTEPRTAREPMTEPTTATEPLTEPRPFCRIWTTLRRHGGSFFHSCIMGSFSPSGGSGTSIAGILAKHGLATPTFAQLQALSVAFGTDVRATPSLRTSVRTPATPRSASWERPTESLRAAYR